MANILTAVSDSRKWLLVSSNFYLFLKFKLHHLNWVGNTVCTDCKSVFTLTEEDETLNMSHID